MNEHFISAEYIHNGHDFLESGSVLVISNDGIIKNILHANEIESSKIEFFNGIVCPGFVNTHCHLELSHLKNKIAQKSSLENFIKDIEGMRSFNIEEIEAAELEADKEMFNNGIVAVGDICNTLDTYKIKLSSPIYYHNFLEVFAFNPSKAEKVYNKGLQHYNTFSQISKYNNSLTLHAPYSASTELINLVKEDCKINHSILSIHNQESAAEDEMFIHKKGILLERIKKFGNNTDVWNCPGTSALNFLSNKLNGLQTNIQWVHNTFTKKEDIEYALTQGNKIYWCFCPNANLYIENAIPNIPLFKSLDSAITIGTDSLASNQTLSVLEELKTIQLKFPEITTVNLLKWATHNGADFLKIKNQYGTLEIGKKPGINLIKNTKGAELRKDSVCKKLF